MRRRRRISPIELIVTSFAAAILAGTVLLMCPFASKTGEATGFTDALFTAASAACVTGLTVVDTAAHWSLAGKCVILLLIQIGGLGAMTIITGFFSVVRKRASLSSSRLLMQSAGNDTLAGIRTLVRRIFIGTAIFELAGAAVLAARFVPRFGWAKGIWFGLFHSISAFCNAGFDILGDYAGGASLSAFARDPVVLFTVMALIIIGGLGFIVWDDLVSCKFRFRNLKFHSKLVLTVTALLIVLPTGLFLLFENAHAFSGRGFGDKLLMALFQAVTPRTAGFAAVPMAELSDAGALLTMVLMFIGGSSGSTAGGVKTTTVAVVLICAFRAARGAQPTVFRRRIDGETVRQAVAICAIYISAVLAAVMALCAAEGLALRDCLFEVISAIATVGLSTGVTPMLGIAGKLILTALMFMGRIGGLSMAIFLSGGQTEPPVKLPSGRLLVG